MASAKPPVHKQTTLGIVSQWLSAPIPQTPPAIDAELVRQVEQARFLYKPDYKAPDLGNPRETELFSAGVAVENDYAKHPYPIRIRNGKLYSTGEAIVYRAIAKDGAPSKAANLQKCLWIVCRCTGNCLEVFENTGNPGLSGKQDDMAGAKCFATTRSLKEYIDSQKWTLMFPQIEPATMEGLERMVGRVSRRPATPLEAKPTPQEQKRPPTPAPGKRAPRPVGEVPMPPPESEPIQEFRTEDAPKVNRWQEYLRTQVFPERMSGADCQEIARVVWDKLTSAYNEAWARKEAETKEMIDALTEHRNRLQNELETLQRLQSEESEKITQYEADIRRLVGEYNNARAETAKWQRKSFNQDKELETMSTTKRQLDELREQYDALRKASEGAKPGDTIIDRLQGDMSKLKSELRKTREELDRVTARNKTLEGGAAAKPKELEATKQELEATKQALAAAKQESLGATQELASARQELTSATQELTSARQELDATKADLVAARRENDATAADKIALQKDKSETAAKSAAAQTLLTKRLADTMKELNELRQRPPPTPPAPGKGPDITTLEKRVADAEAASLAAQNARSVAEDTLKTAQAKLREQEAAAARITREKDDALARLKALPTPPDQGGDREARARAEAEVARITKERDDALAEVGRLKATPPVTAPREEQDAAATAAADREARARAEAMALKQDLDAQKMTVALMQSRLDTVQKQLEASQGDLAIALEAAAAVPSGSRGETADLKRKLQACEYNLRMAARSATGRSHDINPGFGTEEYL